MGNSFTKCKVLVTPITSMNEEIYHIKNTHHISAGNNLHVYIMVKKFIIPQIQEIERKQIIEKNLSPKDHLKIKLLYLLDKQCTNETNRILEDLNNVEKYYVELHLKLCNREPVIHGQIEVFRAKAAPYPKATIRDLLKEIEALEDSDAFSDAIDSLDTTNPHLPLSHLPHHSSSHHSSGASGQSSIQSGTEKDTKKKLEQKKKN